MYKILRIAFSVIAAVLVTACIFVGIYVNFYAAIACAAAALFFFVFCMFFKYLQEEKEGKQSAKQKELSAAEITAAATEHTATENPDEKKTETGESPDNESKG